MSQSQQSDDQSVKDLPKEEDFDKADAAASSSFLDKLCDAIDSEASREEVKLFDA